MRYGVAIVGPHDEISGFAALGVKSFACTEADDAVEILLQFKRNIANEQGEVDDRFAIVFVNENLLRAVSDEDYKRLSAGALPAIIPLPGSSGSTGFGNEKIRRIVEKAVGSDIFGN